MSNKQSGLNQGQAKSVVEKTTQQIDATQKITHDEFKKTTKELNGPKGLEPTRYGDWESKGRCYDF